jgi:hypothetical protein
MSQYPPPNPHHDEVYGYMERELVFKLLASHALVDPEFYEELKNDPEAAANALHIRLTVDDVNYLKKNVKWDEIDKYAANIREARDRDAVTNSW